jgi:hypothetical protein
MIDYLIEQIYFLLADLEEHGKSVACMVDGLHELLAAIEQDNASVVECAEKKSKNGEVEF